MVRGVMADAIDRCAAADAIDRCAAPGGPIRAARRPSEWRAPGPPPVPPADIGHLGPRPDEDLCFLTGDWRIFQRLDGHRWSLDDLVTAWMAADAAAIAPPRRIADLGCGIGSVLLMMMWRFPAATGVGVEAQEISVDLARRSIAWNGVAERCLVQHADFRNETILAREKPFDLITGTPPYLRPGEGAESHRPQFGPCHFEHRGGLEAYCDAAARLLKPEGAFVLCAGAAQHDRMLDAARRAGLAVARRRPVVPRDGKAALFSVYALRRAPAIVSAVDEPPLIVRDRDGRRTQHFIALRADMGMPP